MRFLTIVVLAFLFTVSSFSQSHSEDIKKEAQIYYDYMTEMDLDGILDYMYPKVFDMASKEQMKTGMLQMFDSPQLKVEFLSNEVTSVSQVEEVEGVNYALVYYKSEMRMTFLTEKDKSEEERKSHLDLMKSTLATQFGAENITIDTATTSLVISHDASMFAIKDPQYDGWKFLANEKNMEALVNTMIPEAVRSRLSEKD
ncbi:hypothetical protein [Hyunsoonleella ulvae]|uniref:hypothetical protein n=1 Tax=Hyunsoonleella ulvae TaxID=2799948 RepID=UPI001939AEC0|nr:hypothetical protein [Hyunsoonleella ulvae]